MTISVLVVGFIEIVAGVVCHQSARAPRILRGKRIATLILGIWLIGSGLLVVLGQVFDAASDILMRINEFSAIGAIPAIWWAQHLDQDATKKIVLIREIAGLLGWRAMNMPNAEPILETGPLEESSLPPVPAIGWIYDEEAADAAANEVKS